MMRYYGNFGGHSFGGGSLICALISLVIFIDLVLLGVWLWKRIKREDLCPKNHEKHCDHPAH